MSHKLHNNGLIFCQILGYQANEIRLVVLPNQDSKKKDQATVQYNPGSKQACLSVLAIQ